MNEFINQIELAKKYCAEQNMILVKILIPRVLSEEITKIYKPLYADTSLRVNAFDGIPGKESVVVLASLKFPFTSTW